MRHIAGAALITTAIAAGFLLAWRLIRGIEWWLVDSGAAHVLMWSIVAALVLTVFALPAAMWGLAARCWIIRMETNQRLESTAHVLAKESRQRLVGDFGHPNDLQA